MHTPGRKWRLTRIEAIAFIAGMSIMIIEILGARMFVPFYGNTFFVWTSIIGVVMASMSLGYYRGGVEGDRETSYDGLSNILFKSSALTAAIPFLLLLGGIFSDVDRMWGAVFGTLVSLSPATYQLAKVSPYCIRLSTRNVEDSGKTSGSIYAVSTLGSIIGTFLSGFLLIPLFRLRHTLFLLAILLLALSILLKKKTRQAVFKFLDCGLILCLILIQLVILPSTAFLTTSESADILLEKETVYNSLSVYEYHNPSKNKTARVMKLGRLIQGGIYLEDGESYYDYADLLSLPWLLKPDIREVLVLGNGAGVGVWMIHEKHPDALIDVVDIDPEVFKAATKFFPEKEGERVRFIADDARMYLQESDKKYDLIVMDVFGSNQYIPFHLVTVEMLEEVKSSLADDGVYFQNLVSAVEGERSQFIRSMNRGLDQVFGKTFILPIEKNLSVVNTVVVLSQPVFNGYHAPAFLDEVDVAGEKKLLSKAIKLYMDDPLSLNYSENTLLVDEHAPVEIMKL